MVTDKAVTPLSVNRDSHSSAPLVIYCINIRCLLAHSAELSYQLELHEPHIVLIQESWLNATTKEINLVDYKLIERRDRSQSENRGGVISVAREGMKNKVHISKSSNSERMWHYLHLDHGNIASGNWYRSPSSSLDQIEELANESVEIKKDVIGCILMGDLNIH